MDKRALGLNLMLTGVTGLMWLDYYLNEKLKKNLNTIQIDQDGNEIPPQK